jgi:hypothetical protein
MKYIIAIIFSVFALSASAEDGLVTQFVITKVVEGSNTQQSYNNAVLVNFNDVHSFDFNGLYSLKLTTRTEDFKKVNVLINLKDLSTGKPYYIGGHATDLTVGDSTSFKLNRDGSTYTVDIDTSFGKLP